MRPFRCPGCNGRCWHECVTEDGAKPTPGDVSICDRCFTVFAFTTDGTRAATDDERAVVMAHPSVIAMLDSKRSRA